MNAPRAPKPTALPFVSERPCGRTTRRIYWPAKRPVDVLEGYNEGEAWGIALARHYCAAWIAGADSRGLLARIIRDALGDDWPADPRFWGMLRVIEELVTQGARVGSLNAIERRMEIEHEAARLAAATFNAKEAHA